MPPDLDPDIAHWLRTWPPIEVDVADITAVRQMAADYMRETGGPAPRFTHDEIEFTTTELAGVAVTQWVPRTTTRTDAAVMAVHGGGFIVGSALGAERIAVPLALQHQIPTISVEYRLAPEHPAPAALADVISVLTELPFTRVALYGSSAGACLAAGTAIWARDQGIDIAGQVLSCPALDDRVIDDVWSPTWTFAATTHMWRHYLGKNPNTGDPLWPYVIPGRHRDLAHIAPVHMVVATHDTLRSQAMTYAQRLAAAGVSVALDDVPGTVHGFDGLFPDCAVADAALARQVAALAGWLTAD